LDQLYGHDFRDRQWRIDNERGLNVAARQQRPYGGEYNLFQTYPHDGDPTLKMMIADYRAV
jgi:hypothetical protein